MPGDPVRVNFGTAATATTVIGRSCYMTALSIVSLTSGTNFVNIYDATGTAGITVGTTAATLPTLFIPIEAGGADVYSPGSGVALKRGLVANTSPSNTGTHSDGCTMNLAFILE